MVLAISEHNKYIRHTRHELQNSGPKRKKKKHIEKESDKKEKSETIYLAHNARAG